MLNTITFTLWLRCEKPHLCTSVKQEGLTLTAADVECGTNV